MRTFWASLSWTRLAAAVFFAGLLVPSLAHGQPQNSRKQLRLPLPNEHSPRYVPIPFEGNIEALFRDRLQFAKDLEPLKKLIDEARRNPAQSGVAPELLKLLDLNDPLFRAVVRGWRAKQAPDTPLNLESLQELLKEWGGGLQGGSLPQTARGNGDLPAGTGAGPARQGSAPEQSWDAELLNRWLGEWLENADQYEIGAWLRDSPAFQQGVTDFRRLMNLDSAGLSPDNLPMRLRLPEGLRLQVAQGAFSGLRNLSLPTLPQLKLPQIRVGGWRLPGIALPRWGAAGGGSGGGLIGTLLWFAGVGVVILLGWRLVRRWAPRQSSRLALDELGPWPVDPAQVATRGQLVRAFDYLAQLVLGLDVRTWNHHAVAREMQQAQANHAAAATELAQLYETARYTAGAEPLSAADQAAARRCLALLARRS